MLEVIFGLLMLVLGVLVWAAIGHGIWVLIASIGKALSGGAPDVPPTPCKHCGAPRGVVEGRCNWCNKLAVVTPPAPAASSVAAEIEGTLKQLDRLWRRGILNDEDHVRLRAACQRDLDRLSGQTPSVAAAAAVPLAPLTVAESSDVIDAEIVYLADVPPARPAPTAPVHPLDRPEPPFVPAAPPPPRAKRALADVLTGFMLERNIRWGELVGGLLIVGSVAGLVLSLRDQLQGIPFFPALLFLIGTSALHGAGLYTLRQWNLHATSRGVLLIALLLVPLNFVAAILISDDNTAQLPVTSPLYVLAVSVGLLAYGAISYTGARALVRSAWPGVALAVLGPSALLLAIHRAIPAAASERELLLFGSLAVAPFIIGLALAIASGQRWRRLSLRRAQPLLMTLGLGAFAVAMPLALLVARTPGHWSAFAHLSPVFALAGASVVASGLFLLHRTKSRALAPLAVTGTALAIFGGVVMLGAVAFAWPDPARLVIVGALCAVTLAALALLDRAPFLHVPAVACAALATLVSVHWWQGTIDTDSTNLSAQIVNSWLAGRSGLVLTALGLLVSLAAGLLWKKQARDHALYLLASAGGLALLSLANATYAGLFNGIDAPLTTLTFAIYAVAITAAVVVRPHDKLTLAAAALWLITGVQAFGYNGLLQAWLSEHGLLADRPVLLFVLFHAGVTILIALAVALLRGATSLRQHVVQPLAEIAFFVSLTTTWFAVAVRDQQFALHAGYVLTIGVIWIIGAVLLYRPELLTAGQAVSTLAVAYAALALCTEQAWWEAGWFDPRRFALVTFALAVWGIPWSIARRMSERWPRAHALLAPAWPPFDAAILSLLVVFIVGGTAWAAAHGAMEELRLVRESLPAATLAFIQTVEHPLTWLAIGAIAIAIVVALWERLDVAWLALLTGLGVAPCSLLALTALDEVATASAWRWALAGYLVICVAVICARDQLRTVFARLPGGWRGKLAPLTYETCLTFVMLGVATPIVVLTIIACTLAADGIAPRGPLPETLFANLGWTISYTVPLAVIVAALIALGLRERRAGFVLAGSAVWQLVVALGCLMPVLTTGGALDTALAVQLLQWSTIGLGAYGLLWLALDRWLTSSKRTGSALYSLLSIQVLTLLIALGSLSLWAAGWTIAHATRGLPPAELPLGSPLSFVALLVSAAVFAWYALSQARQTAPYLAAAVAISAVPFVAVALTPLNVLSPWLNYHALLTGWLLVAGGATAIVCYDPRRRVALVTATTMAAVVMGLSLLSGWTDRVPAWATAVNLGVLLMLMCLGAFRPRHVFAYASVVVTLITASQAYLHFQPNTAWTLPDFVAANLLATTIIGGFWLGIEIDRERHRFDHVLPSRGLPLPILLMPILTAVVSTYLALCLAAGLAQGLFDQDHFATSPPNLVALLALGIYLFGALWYDRQRTALACLFTWGLTVALAATEFVPRGLSLPFVALPTATAIYLALVGWLWQSSARLSDFGRRAGVHEPIAGLARTSRWLPLVTLLLAGVVIVADVGFVLNSDVRLVRYVAGFGPMLLAIAIVMQAQLERRATMIYLALLSATLAAGLLSWAELPRGGDAILWLQRSIRMLVVLGSLACLYAAVLPRMWGQVADWLTSLRRMAITCGAGAATALAAVLMLEVVQFTAGQPAAISNGEVAIVGVVLTLLAATLATLAVWPQFAVERGFDARESTRMGYVYAAQIVLALAFGHLYLTRPHWFDGLLRPYWPFIVMAIAFAGVAVGEWFRRLNLRVLAEPLQRSGSFLPLLPALGWWIEATRGEPTTDYALVMFVVGLLYVVLTVVRQSAISAIAAAVAGNVALWSLMAEQEGWNFSAHPQFWLIPPALSVLAAIQLHQKRLTSEQLTASRYACMLVIYLSSTSEIFITGITSFWPPLILASLAVCGVMLGIALQIRAFLYLGTSFVFLSMVTMVWHAARAYDQTWPWWAFGICVGLMMLVFFGLFEKKRVEITALVDKLRQWEQ